MNAGRAAGFIPDIGVKTAGMNAAARPIWKRLVGCRRDSADGRSDMAHLDVPGPLGDAECTMRGGRLGSPSERENG